MYKSECPGREKNRRMSNSKGKTTNRWARRKDTLQVHKPPLPIQIPQRNGSDLTANLPVQSHSQRGQAAASTEGPKSRDPKTCTFTMHARQYQNTTEKSRSPLLLPAPLKKSTRTQEKGRRGQTSSSRKSACRPSTILAEEM